MFMPSPGGMPDTTSLEQKASLLIGRPVGVSMRNGNGVTGVLCAVQNGEIFLLQYLYHSQFATFHYPLIQVADILAFPSCR
ncbi:hypothetical protein [Paenibacillus sp. MMS18-CY102]|uniref:hypothetical protein n=1 Tax=Paenibacillus sp. MMS18-CY102 TaxID=2682849 RepID=UPI0013658B96|nr:hypothetical protein [Paenibacillus sp. MMS18-CY102]MWC27765.1 hypothetical protein [Paenibacillus sp. MMS18-CY102]